MNIPFVKYQGAGNDFILIEGQKIPSSLDLSLLAQVLCDRRHGIGADGLLLLLDSGRADYRMRIFNADGSEPAMCGNGIRCLIDYLHHFKGSAPAISIETPCTILKCSVQDGHIAVCLGSPDVIHWPLQLPEGDFYVVDTGVPHAVRLVDDPDLVDVVGEGRKIRFHPTFAPHGVNVNFAAVDSDGRVRVRTYERGVESETLACGTGAAAAAFVAAELKYLSSPVSVATRSSFATLGYTPSLSFSLTKKEEGKPLLEMLGSARRVFEGTVALDSLPVSK